MHHLDWLENAATRRRARQALLWSVGLTLALYLIPFGQLLAYPLMLLSTLFHELGHGIAAVAVGGSFESLAIFADGSGVAQHAGGNSSVGHAIVALSTTSDVQMKITGHQWWWEIEYQDPVASNTFVTANEFHIPVGKIVDLQVVSADVIHSFWVPNLAGKRDLIPGRNNHVVLRAERAGEYIGQCSEFCGLQHAHMRIAVVAQSEDEFQKWLAHQREPAPQPTGEKEIRGQQIFTSGPCVMCHTVRGTIASSRAGPELTHLASRRALGAGVIPNTRAHLFAWITDSQIIKPGNRMPQVPMDGADLDDLATWLETLR